MKLVQTILLMGVAIMLIATLMIPALDDAKGGEGEETTKTVTEEITGAVGRYSEAESFTLSYSTEGGSVLNGETWAANKGGEGAIICDKILFLNRDTGPSFYLVNTEGTQGLRGTAASASLSDGSVTVTSTSGNSYTVAVAFCYIPDTAGDYAVTRTTSGTTVVNETAPVVLWVGTNTEYAVITGTATDRHVGFWVKSSDTPPIKTVPPTLTYTTKTLGDDTTVYTLTGGNPSTPSLALTPYTYTYEVTEKGGEGGLSSSLTSILDVVPILAIVGILIGAVAMIAGGRDE